MKTDNGNRPQPTTIESEEGDIKSKQAKAFTKVLISYWYWFVLSLIVAGLAFVLLKRILPEPHTEYYTKVSARYQNVNNSDAILADDALSTAKPIWQNIVLPENREIYKILNSTSIIEDAGRALNYEVNYYQQGQIGDRNIWDERPFDIYFLSAGRDDEFQVKVVVEPNGLTLKDIQGIRLQNSLTQAASTKTFFLPFDVPTNTPLGVIKATRIEHPLVQSLAKQEKEEPITEVLVVKSTEFDARVALDANIKLNNDHDMLLVAVETSAPSGFALSFLHKVIEIAEARTRTRIDEELSRANTNIDSCLKILNAGGGSISDEEERSIQVLGITSAGKADREALTKVLEGFRLKNMIDKETLNSQPLLVYIDKPHVGVKSGNNSIFLLAVLFISAIMIPALLIYLRIVMRKRILIPEEATVVTDMSLLGDLPRGTNRSEERKRIFDRIAIHLDNLQSQQTNPPSSGKIIAICATRPAAGVSYTTEQLTAALRRRNKQVLHLYMSDECTEMEEINSTNGGLIRMLPISDNEQLESILNAFASKYQYILIDCPTPSETNDAYALLPYTSSYIWVVRHLNTKTDELESIKMFAQGAQFFYIYNRH